MFGSDFPFRSLNKLSPLVAYQKIGYMARAPIGPGPSIQVSSQSDHLLGYFFLSNRRTAHNHICSCKSLAYVVRPRTLKRKSGCPTGINKNSKHLVQATLFTFLLSTNALLHGTSEFDIIYIFSLKLKDFISRLFILFKSSPIAKC